MQNKESSSSPQSSLNRLKILLSAYACEPDKGSEPGVGWKWVDGLSKRVNLTVVTRSNNRDSIEKEISRRTKDDCIHKVTFIYHDLTPVFRSLKRRKILGTLGYYFLWQYSLAQKYSSLGDDHDVTHHLTFCTLLCPGFWKLKKAAFVVGPVGAPLVNKHYYRLFGSKSLVQRARGVVMNRFLSLPWLKRILKNAAAVFPANSETQSLLHSHGIATREVMLDTGAPPLPEKYNEPRDAIAGKVCRFLYAGRIERRKGLELALRAFDLAIQEGFECWEFFILGDGPDRVRLVLLSKEMGLENHIKFIDPVPHDEMQVHFNEADVFVFTSVRDTSGGVNLEAMTAGLPILCLAHQGVADITDDTCAIRIAPESVSNTIEGLASGIKRFIHEPETRGELGIAAKLRAINHFSWDAKFDRMVEVYEEIVLSSTSDFQS